MFRCCAPYPAGTVLLVLSKYFNAGAQSQQRLINVACQMQNDVELHLIFNDKSRYVGFRIYLLHVCECLLPQSFQFAHCRPSPPSTADSQPPGFYPISQHQITEVAVVNHRNRELKGCRRMHFRLQTCRTLSPSASRGA